MRKTILALTLTLVASLICTAFAAEAPAAKEPPSINDTVTTTPVETLGVNNATIPNTGVEEPTKEEIKNQYPQPVLSDEPVTIEDMSNLLFFDIDKANVMDFAASTNCVIKKVQGTVTLVATNELQINVPELNNDFCFNCVEPFPQQLGETVTVWLVIQVQN